MIWIVARREFLEYMKSMKFLIGFLITLALISISTYINISDFKQRQQDYVSAREEMKGNRFNVIIDRAPEVLSTLVQGKDRKLGTRLEMSYMHLPSKMSGYMGEQASQQHRYVAGFASIDYAFIVRVILSLMVIFLIYNAVSGEKSQGTLRLVYSNSIPRHALLLGKSIGGLTIVILTLLIATIVCLLFLILDRGVAVAQSDWSRILGIFCGSAVYLMCFFTLGLFASVLVNRPSIALTILLQAWIFLNIIYPNLAIVAAESWYRLPGEEEIAQEKKAAFQPYEDELKKTDDEFNKEVMSGQETSREVWLKIVTLFGRKTDIDHQVDMEFGRQLTRQADLAQWLSVLSPAALYDQMMERFARTGTEEHERFMEAVYRQWQRHVELEKLRIQDPENSEKHVLPALDFFPEPTGQSLVGVARQISILLLISGIFFALAYTSFLKKDVR